MPNLYQLNQLINEKVPAQDSVYLKELSRLLLGRAPLEFFREFDPHQLLALVRGAATFLDTREPHEVLLRAYSPTIDFHGWKSRFTAIEVALRDRPFIVDSLRAELARNGVSVHALIHPILPLTRNSAGQMQRDSLGDKSGQREAYELFLVEELEPDRASGIETRLKAILQDVALATDDHEAMRQKARQISEELSAEEPQLQQMSMLSGAPDVQQFVDFLEWLLDDNFVFLGYREYVIQEHGGVRCLRLVGETALGILRKLEASNYLNPVPFAELPDNLKRRITTGPVLLVTKSNAESTVHRPARMDYIGIKRLNQDGEIQGELRFLGLFTGKAHSTVVDRIPILRRKLKQVLALDEAIVDSHDFNQIVGLFNSMPREELFWSSPEQLHQEIRTIMGVAQDREVRVTVRPDPLARGLAVMVIMPRSKFNSRVRLNIQGLLTRRLRASHVDYHLAMGQDQAQLRFHFFFTTDLSVDEVDLNRLNLEIARLSRSWEDEVLELLQREFETQIAAELAERYCRAFPDGYKVDVTPEEAVLDLRFLEGIDNQRLGVDIRNPESSSESSPASHLKIYHPRPTLILSEVFPILENLGLRVIEQISYPLDEAGGDESVGGNPQRGLDVFRVQDQAGQPLDLQSQRECLVEALLCLLKGSAENDKLNQLVVSAQIPISQIALLRTYRSYLAQLQPGTSRSFVTDTLLAFPKIAATLYRFFHARSCPDIENRKEGQAKIMAEFLQQLNTVSSLPADLTLRSLFELVAATVRTNFFLHKGYISLKVESAKVREMPEPRPMWEVMVSGPDVEGVHLRGGPVARGGLRWSDRPDDYRTEVLGLMKTQMTKNSVIVPVGSKGGFVVKHPPSNREELAGYVQQQYRTFVRGLLDVTDNLKETRIIPPPGVVCHDAPDPYLVVAADKGTATFSDLANEISADYDFWLGDAFASGGSYGYDHKKEAITARGAWECVARHFRELNLNVQEREFTVVGIGDMSGDVFGNGMLYTDKLCLIGAFNHVHIFVDPNPDASSGARERKRLFELPRSSWDDYDRTLISPGGGVFSRQAKSIPISSEIRERLGIEEESLSGEALIRALLQAKVDLLWNGGIGTYVKAGSERNSDVGDAGNDKVRIDATAVRARVVGEGGNLGFTQLARIEYCLSGGRMNTDAIDNSGGVDMSDHEVNLKILFQPLVQDGVLSFNDRNRLLREMTDEVAQLVLQNNYMQSLCLSQAEAQSRKRLGLYRSFLEYLSDYESLRPEVEYLPSNKQLDERAGHAKGLTRPELAVLLAYAKMGITTYLLNTDLPDEPYLQYTLEDYFPGAIAKNYSEHLKNHPLRREIVTCQLTNLLADRLGIPFLHEVIREAAGDPADVVWASLASIEVLQLQDLWNEIFQLDNAFPTATQYMFLNEIGQTARQCVEWILGSDLRQSDFGAFVARYRDAIANISNNLAEYLPPKERNRYKRKITRVSKHGIDGQLATRIANLGYLTSMMGIVDTARESSLPPEQVVRPYYDLGERLGLGSLRDRLIAMPHDTNWERIAACGLVQDLRVVQKRLTVDYLLARGAGQLTVSNFLSSAPRGLKRFHRFYSEMRRSQHFSRASISVLSRILLETEQEMR